MAELTYPPWSAPTTMERERKKSDKWSNIKRVMAKPWSRRSQRRKPHRSPTAVLSPFAFGEFSRFGAGREKINPLSGGGNPLLFQQLTGLNHGQRPALRLYDDREKEEPPKGVFAPPTPKPSRPPLSNVFPMYDSPTLSRPKTSKAMPLHSSNPSSVAPNMERRKSTPAVKPMPQHLHVHPSAYSTTSDITYERTGRRERRASAIRALPMLPSNLDVCLSEEKVDLSDEAELHDFSRTRQLSQVSEDSEVDDVIDKGVLTYADRELQSTFEEGKENDFAEEFVRQLTIGDRDADVLY